MLDCLNSWWVLLICFIIFLFIIKKIYNMTQPFDTNKFMEQCINQEKLKKKFNLKDIPSIIPSLTSYYVGL
jgi:hypothetical protein